MEIRIEVQNLQDENTGSNQKIRSMEDMMNTNQRKRKNMKKEVLKQKSRIFPIFFAACYGKGQADCLVGQQLLSVLSEECCLVRPSSAGHLQPSSEASAYMLCTALEGRCDRCIAADFPDSRGVSLW